MSENIVIFFRHVIGNLAGYRILDEKEYPFRILNESLRCLFSVLLGSLKLLWSLSSVSEGPCFNGRSVGPLNVAACPSVLGNRLCFEDDFLFSSFLWFFSPAFLLFGYWTAF